MITIGEIWPNQLYYHIHMINLFEGGENDESEKFAY